MKHFTKEALKRFGIATTCMTLVASASLPFMGNKMLPKEELTNARQFRTTGKKSLYRKFK